jgi:hypothetical protein
MFDFTDTLAVQAKAWNALAGAWAFILSLYLPHSQEQYSEVVDRACGSQLRTMVCFRLREDAVACKRRDHHCAVAAQAVVLLQGKRT